VSLARAGREVELGCRTREQVTELQTARENERYLPGIVLPESVRVVRAAELELTGQDLVCLAVPARALPGVLAAHGERIPGRAGLLVLCEGVVLRLGMVPSEFVSRRRRARAVAVLGGPSHAAHALEHGASVVVGSSNQAFGRQLADALTAAGLEVSITVDVTGVELASAAKNAAVLAAAAAAPAGPNAAGAAAGKVFAEVDALARRRGSRPETFAGLAEAGDLVATVVAAGSRNRRAGELLAQGVPSAEIGAVPGQAARLMTRSRCSRRSRAEPTSKLPPSKDSRRWSKVGLTRSSGPRRSPARSARHDRGLW
jgi:glycerol-3-phosphate dehydrogenase